MTNDYDPNAPLQHLFLQKGYQGFLKLLQPYQREELAKKLVEEQDKVIQKL